MRWEDLLLENNYGFVHQVVTYHMKSHTCINSRKMKTSACTIPITNTPKTILMALRKESGFILDGEKIWCHSRTQRVRKRAVKCLDITDYLPYDFRTTSAVQAKESIPPHRFLMFATLSRALRCGEKIVRIRSPNRFERRFNSVSAADTPIR